MGQHLCCPNLTVLASWFLGMRVTNLAWVLGSAKNALDLFGTTKKQPLTCKDCLIEHFEIGVNNDDYWGYEQMPIQNYDAFDLFLAYWKIVRPFLLRYTQFHTITQPQYLTTLPRPLLWWLWPIYTSRTSIRPSAPDLTALPIRQLRITIFRHWHFCSYIFLGVNILYST